MSNHTERALFGGAIFCAGLASVGHAQVSGEEFRFSADVTDQYDGYTNTGVNESFDIQGGFEIVPFDRAARGGSAYDFPYARQDARVTGDAQELDGGGVYARLSTDVMPGYGYDFPFGPDSSASMAFTVESEMRFELTLNRFSFDNDRGFGSHGLLEVGGDSIFVANDFADFTDGSVLVASGTLGPGEYLLFSNSFGLAEGDISLGVFVPAPGSVAGLLGLSLVAARRKR